MSLTTEESRLLEQRDALLQGERDIIDDVFSDLETALREGSPNRRAPTDDRAARLEAALIRYMIESRP